MIPATRRIVAVACVALLIALVLPPLISLRHFRSTIDQSLSRGLGRQVTVENISLQLVRIRGVERVGMYRGRPYKLR